MNKNILTPGNPYTTDAQIQKTANQVSVITILINVLLSVFKFFAGIWANSGAMISDAIHSASDVFSTFIVIIGMKLSSKEPDKEHPYGHERMECVAAIVLAVILFITGLSIGSKATQTIINGNYINIQIPGTMALIAAIL